MTFHKPNPCFSSLRFFPSWNPNCPFQVIGLLYMVNDILKIKNIIPNLVEFGSDIGESAILFAGFDSIKKIHCVDIWRDKNNEEIFDIRFQELKTKIVKHKCRTENFFHEDVDMVYIDADHSYKAVKKDLEKAKELINSNGIISGHDYHKDATGVRAAVDEFINTNNYKLNTYPDSSWFLTKK